MSATWIAAASAAAVALMSAFLTYNTTRRLSSHSEKIAFLNRQLSELYGPLHALNKASETSWNALRSRHIGENVDTELFDEHTKTLWKYWVSHVFVPMNRRMLDTILLHTDLIDGIRMPECFTQFCAHVNGYEVTLARWQDGDDSVLGSVNDYPGDSLAAYLEFKYEELKRRQLALLADGRWRIFRLGARIQSEWSSR